MRTHNLCLSKNTSCWYSLEEPSLRERLRTHEIFTKDKTVVVFFPELPPDLHKIICCGCVLETPQRGDSNTHPHHMILWRNNENYHFLSI